MHSRFPGHTVIALAAAAIASFSMPAPAQQPVVTDDRESLSFDDLTYWRGLAIDKQEKHEGTQSGAWEDTVAVDRVRYRGKVIDASGAKAVRFWLHSREATGAVIALALFSENPASSEPDYYFANVKIDFSGWREVTIPFTEMKVRREPLGFHRITEILFASSGYGCGDANPRTALRLDDLRFVDPATEPPRLVAGGVVPAGFERLLSFEDALLWKGLIQDSDQPAEGQYSCRWQNMTETNRVVAGRFPADLSGYESMLVSVWSAKATGAQIALILQSENPATESADYYAKLLTIDWAGWKELRIPLSQLAPERTPLGLNAITGFRMASSGYKIKTSDAGTVLKFDNMRFAPKGAPPATP